jgi:CYRIA/CYRIB Rac1 binding domain
LIAQFQREETQLFVLRVMVGLVILYDHVHPQGAFVKASNVDVRVECFNLQSRFINFEHFAG